MEGKMNGREYSESEDKIILEGRNKGKPITYAALAQTLGRSSGGVAKRYWDIGGKPSAKRTAKKTFKRVCLKCRNEFDSKGMFRCDPCRKSVGREYNSALAEGFGG
jgi:hypothetical protein